MTAIKPLVGVSACRIEVNGLSMQRCSEKYLMAAASEVAATPMMIPSLPTPLDVASMIARLDGLLLTGSPSNVEPGHYDGPDSVEGTAHDPARAWRPAELFAADQHRDPARSGAGGSCD